MRKRLKKRRKRLNLMQFKKKFYGNALKKKEETPQL